MKRCWSRSCVAVLASLVFAGCATTPRPTGNSDYWSGRIALQTEEDPPGSFSALFELEGSEAQGALTLLTPIGTSIGKLQWAPGKASLQTGSETRESESLDRLVQQVTGTTVPVNALFGWLKGTQTLATGWTADLSAASEGRITAHRYSPEPKATLRIAITQ
jgi:outer membrane lipoprotein LolB